MSKDPASASFENDLPARSCGSEVRQRQNSNARTMLAGKGQALAHTVEIPLLDAASPAPRPPCLLPFTQARPGEHDSSRCFRFSFFTRALDKLSSLVYTVF